MPKRDKKQRLDESLALEALTLHLQKQPNGAYVATSPDLPELLTEGATLADAVNNLPSAVELALEYQQNKARFW